MNKILISLLLVSIFWGMPTFIHGQNTPLSLSDLEKLRREPKDDSAILAKGYALISKDKERIVYLGAMSDTIILYPKYTYDINYVVWKGKPNQKSQYQEFRKEMISNFEYEEGSSFTDMRDRAPGLTYFFDESYFHRETNSELTHYKLYVFYLDEKIVEYRVTLSYFITGS